MSRLNLLILIFSWISISCLKVENTEVIVTSKRLYENYVGKKGTIVIEAEPESEFITQDTSKTTYFKSKIVQEPNYSKEVDCGFWKAEGEDLFIFCNIGEDIPQGNYSLSFRETSTINYNNYLVTLSQNENLEFIKYDRNIIDLYAEKQNIIVEKDKEIYELKFKISSYNQEPIMINYFIFPDCTQEKNNEIVCKITKGQLESILMTKEESRLSVMYISYIRRAKAFPLIPIIDVVYNNIEKTDVYVGITRLLENVVEFDTLIAYETNVTDINNVLSALSSFDLVFKNNNGGKKECSCSFQKYDANPLLIVCFMNNDGTNWLEEITEEKSYNDLNIKYNFKIRPVNNEEKIYCNRNVYGTMVFWTHPQVLDFTKNDNLIIEY